MITGVSIPLALAVVATFGYIMRSEKQHSQAEKNAAKLRAEIELVRQQYGDLHTIMTYLNQRIVPSLPRPGVPDRATPTVLRSDVDAAIHASARELARWRD